METVAGDFSSLQSLGQLMSEEDIAQLAIAVALENLHEGSAQSQRFVCVQAVKINLSKVMSHRRHIDHPAWFTLLQSVQQQIG